MPGPALRVEIKGRCALQVGRGVGLLQAVGRQAAPVKVAWSTGGSSEGDSKQRFWWESSPNTPVGLGSLALHVPFISVTSEVPRGPSAWNEIATPRVWLEAHFPINLDPGPAEFFG